MTEKKKEFEGTIGITLILLALLLDSNLWGLLLISPLQFYPFPCQVERTRHQLG